MLLASHRYPIVGTIMIRLGSFENVGDIANDAEVAGIILTCYNVSITLPIEASVSYLGRLPRRSRP